MTAIYYFRRPYTTFGVYILFSVAMYYFLQLYTTFDGYIPHSKMIYYFRRLYPNEHIFVDLPWIWRRNSTWKVRGNYIDFERQMDVEIMTSIRRGYFDVDSLSKSTKYRWVLHVNFSMLFRRQIDITSVLTVSILSFSNIFCSGNLF